jgi:hypothetical protein
MTDLETFMVAHAELVLAVWAATVTVCVLCARRR